ncbi:MAG: DUF11 domain-containing protein, partial [Methanobacteriaceae archaeon]|nr:DUF11 domain-containing protein [Methanobacteriaceae archaeon]
GAFLNFFTLINKSGDLTVTLSKINQSEFDPNTANNVRTKTLPIPQQVNLVIDQDIDGLDINEANVGDEVTININIENQGDDATGLTIKNLLPDGLDFVSADTHGVGTYDPDTGIWNIGNFNSKEKATLSITVIVNNNAANTVINTAKLETVDQFDWNFNDNSKKTYLNIMEREQLN